ncbi:type IV pilus modification protein PilV [Simiduia agarivorans]|nr:type IV pilus modification protein PilV [Simiduia agarivorans]
MPIRPPLHQTGSGMIELMVGLFVLAVGLMGALALQFSSVRSTQSAVYTSDAQIIAQDMIDRIMAYNDVLTTDDDDDYHNIDTGNAATDPACKDTGCTADQIKAMDTYEWQQIIQSRLPGGRGTVSYLNNVYTIVVMWDRDRTGVDGTNCGGNPAVDLTCYRVEFRL